MRASRNLNQKQGQSAQRDRSRSPVKVTQLDTQSQEDADQDMRTPVATSSMPHKQSYYCSPSSIPLNPDEALAQQWTLQDLGGNGDCFYRACAGARAVAKNDRTLTSDEARVEAAELRLATVAHARKHKERLKEWFAPDVQDAANKKSNKKRPEILMNGWTNRNFKQHGQTVLQFTA